MLSRVPLDYQVEPGIKIVPSKFLPSQFPSTLIHPHACPSTIFSLALDCWNTEVMGVWYSFWEIHVALVKSCWKFFCRKVILVKQDMKKRRGWQYFAKFYNNKPQVDPHIIFGQELSENALRVYTIGMVHAGVIQDWWNVTLVWLQSVHPIHHEEFQKLYNCIQTLIDNLGSAKYFSTFYNQALPFSFSAPE